MRKTSNSVPAGVRRTGPHGQAHAVEGDGALGQDGISERSRQPDGEAHLIATRLPRKHFAHAIDMALDPVTTERVPHPQGALQVDLIALAETAQRRHAQRLGNDIEGELAPPRVPPHDR